MSGDAKMREAAKLMAGRMRLLKKLVVQAREREEQELLLDLREVWEAQDEAALAAYEEALAAITGARPLF